MSEWKRLQRTYSCWKAMMDRCTKPTDPAFPNYGGRGIKVCTDWHRLCNFIRDMGEIPEGLTLDRIDVNGNYEQNNCRWITMKEQARNRRSNRTLTFKGQTKLLCEWSEITGIPRTTITQRLKYGWSVEKTLTYPVREYNRS